jgi:selenocysteine lyase/cysteine desulfurase
MMESIMPQKHHLLIKDQSLSSNRTLFGELERRVYTAIKRYSNVHRGAGQHSMISTILFERAREIILEYLGLTKSEYVVVFGSARQIKNLKGEIKDDNYTYQLFSNDFGLPLGVGGLAARKNALPRGAPFARGGGIVKLVSRNFVIWKDAPQRFEAGTPNILGAITLAAALRIILINKNIFHNKAAPCSAKSILYNDGLEELSGKELLSKLRESVVGDGTNVPTSEGLVPYVNFDNAASTPTFEVIWEVVRKTWRQPDRVLNDIVEEVKRICERFFHATSDRYEIIFTQNTTEGINIVAECLAKTVQKDSSLQPIVLNTYVEHNSNELPWKYTPGVRILRFPVDREGLLDLAKLEKILCDYNDNRYYGKKRIHILAVSGCSNVTGSFNDIEKISALAHRYGSKILVDAAQLAAHRAIDMQRANIDYLTFSGHKMYAPFGAGGLIVRKGNLDEIRSSGKENVAGIAAMGKAMELLNRVKLDVISGEERRLTRRALNGLHQIPDIEVFGVFDETLEKFNKRGPVISFSMRKIHHNLVAKLLAEEGGIGVRDGCLCAHLFVKYLMKISFIQTFFSNIFMLIFPKLTSKSLPGIVRISFSIVNTEEEVDHFIRVLKEITDRPVPIINQFFARLYYGTPKLPKTAAEAKITNFIEAEIRNVYSY